MGATNFDDIVWGINNLDAAYRHAVESALSGYGHDPYNGTISTTHGVNEHKASKSPVSEEEALRIGEDRLDHTEKWGPCEAIRVYETTPAQLETVLYRYTAELSVPSDLLHKSRREQHEQLTELFIKHIRKTAKRDGGLTGSTRWNKPETFVKVEEGTHTALLTRSAGFLSYEFLPQTKTTTVAPKSAKETRFFILVDGDERMPKWDQGFASQAEARAALPKSLRRGSTADNYEIISMTRRAQGDPLVSHLVRPKENKTVKVRVSGSVDRMVEKPKKTGRTGWYFYGWAAC